MCECCEHPLEHAVSRALDAAENGVPTREVLTELRGDLEAWRAR